MKRAAAVLMAAMVAGGVAVIEAAPDAHADTTQFLNDVQAAGFSDGSLGATGLEEEGAWVCAQMDQGQEPGAVANEVYTLTPPNFSRSSTDQFVAIAINDLCPQHIADVQREAQAGS